jgi:hypothetical protein
VVPRVSCLFGEVMKSLAITVLDCVPLDRLQCATSGTTCLMKRPSAEQAPRYPGASDGLREAMDWLVERSDH